MRSWRRTRSARDQELREQPSAYSRGRSGPGASDPERDRSENRLIQRPKNAELYHNEWINRWGQVRATPPVSTDLSGDVGLDVRYGITQNLAADVTVNTDFSQVEANEQQVNLTRFSLFFPEKREFFLENLGLFAFGGAGV